MRSRTSSLLAVLLLVGLLTVVLLARRSPAAGRHDAAVGYHAGQLAPDFGLESLDGKTVHLSDLRGHVVLLNFWATWCAPCRVEMPWLVDFDLQYRGRDLHIVGVNLDDPGTSRETIAGSARERGVMYPVLLGNNTVANDYDARFMPETIFIGPDGKILKSTYGITTREEFEDNIKEALAKSGR